LRIAGELPAEPETALSFVAARPKEDKTLYHIMLKVGPAPGTFELEHSTKGVERAMLTGAQPAQQGKVEVDDGQ
jgi:hypothetical protein